MRDRIRRALGDVRADDALLAQTAARLERARTGRRRGGHSGRLRWAAATAAMVALVAGVFGYRGLYAVAAAYVSVDVNPSIELTLNRADRVIDAAAYNAEGEALLRAVDTAGRPCEDAVSALLAEMEAQGYFTGDPLVTMTVQAADGAKAEALCDALRQSVPGQMDAEVFPVTRQAREKARGCHMSAAKYLAIQELMEVDETATLEAYSDATLHHIRTRTQSCREAGGQGHSSGQRHGHGHGYGGGRGWD